MMWFEREGLCFTCTGCGDCCRRPGYVFLEDGDEERLAAHLEIDVEELRRRYLTRVHGEWVLEVLEGQECVFLDGDACGVYGGRPTQCRTYPFWPEVVADPRSWDEEREHCPGIDHGSQIFDEDDVLRRLFELEGSGDG
jgi:hypothetical protein